ncbi:MAG: hypothetical protein R3F62_23465 [Planctomycetota bacterium]
MGGITNAQFATIRCAQCGGPFRVYPKPGQSGLPDEVPYVDGGLIAFSDDSGAEVYYHGYVRDSNSCWTRAQAADA